MNEMDINPFRADPGQKDEYNKFLLSLFFVVAQKVLYKEM